MFDWRAIAYVLSGAVVAGVALQCSIALSASYTDLRLKAAEQQREVPPLAALYFRNTVRVLFVTALGFLLGAGADAALSAFAGQRLGLLGYGSGVLLLVCGFALLLQARTDSHLKLLKPHERLIHTIGGMGGIAAACGGMILVTWRGSVW